MFARRCVKKHPRGGIPLSEGAEKILHQNTNNSSRNSSSSVTGVGGREEEAEKSDKDEEVPVLKNVTRRTRVPIAGKHYLTAVRLAAGCYRCAYINTASDDVSWWCVRDVQKSARETRQAEETLHAFRSDPKLNLHDDNRATAVFDADPDRAHDHRAILERNEEIGRKIEKGELESGIYRGQGAHRVYVHRSEGALSNAKSTGLYGPVRGTNNVRMTMYVDYNPEICKDYKETGYCGFGNTCKFLHDRHDYKGGWQIEREWQQQQQKKQAKLARLAARSVGCSGSGEERISSSSGDDSSSCSSDEESDEEKLPFACLKCREKWTEDMNPVVTRCKHYFCEKCAFSHYSSSIKCYTCGSETQGIFNAAHKLIEKVRQKEAELGKERKRDRDAPASKRSRKEASDASSSDRDAGDASGSSAVKKGGEGDTSGNNSSTADGAKRQCAKGGDTAFEKARDEEQEVEEEESQEEEE